MFVSNTFSALTGAQSGQDFSEPETAVWFFDPLLAQSYDLIVIDPPGRSQRGVRQGKASRRRRTIA